jgi:hypothetical protein
VKGVGSDSDAVDSIAFCFVLEIGSALRSDDRR